MEEVASYGEADHIVLTGGEPLIHEESVPLLDRLSDRGYHTTVKTNGNFYRDAAIDLASISPKLATSTPTPERDPTDECEWEARHEECRIDLNTLGMVVDMYDYQLKFVITGPDDMSEITNLLDRIRKVTTSPACNENILLIPEGMTLEELDDTREIVADLAGSGTRQCGH